MSIWREGTRGSPRPGLSRLSPTCRCSSCGSLRGEGRKNAITVLINTKRTLCRNVPAMFIVLYFPPHKQTFYGAITLIESNAQQQQLAKASKEYCEQAGLWIFKSIQIILYGFSQGSHPENGIKMFFGQNPHPLFYGRTTNWSVMMWLVSRLSQLSKCESKLKGLQKM